MPKFKTETFKFHMTQKKAEEIVLFQHFKTKKSKPNERFVIILFTQSVRGIFQAFHAVTFFAHYPLHYTKITHAHYTLYIIYAYYDLLFVTHCHAEREFLNYKINCSGCD